MRKSKMKVAVRKVEDALIDAEIKLLRPDAYRHMKGVANDLEYLLVSLRFIERKALTLHEIAKHYKEYR